MQKILKFNKIKKLLVGDSNKKFKNYLKKF